MKNLLNGVLLGAAVLAAGTIGMQEVSANEQATVWTPRTVEQIKAEISGNEYTIKWGDTLSAISGATNISVQKLAEWNSIGNVDVIFAGNKLVFEGNIASVQDQNGNTVSQAVINENDKVDPGQPIGQAPATGSNNDQGSPAATVPTPPATGDSGSTGGGSTVTPPTGADNGSTGGGGAVTPPTGGDNGSTGGGNETTPEQPKPEEPTRVTPLGNSGMEFNTIDEANEWGMAELMNPDSVWKEYTGFVTKPLMWSDGLVRSYSVDFYN